ncbi:MAG: hypothetical protein QOF41_1440 [Methylobacteriaceae bacterium]|jgi:hypothetical protein|nr:hypothetical protein [Methylobacteriaceae bacterium]
MNLDGITAALSSRDMATIEEAFLALASCSKLRELNVNCLLLPGHSV